MSTPNLLDLLQNLLRDPAGFREDPEGFLSPSGDVSPDDVHEALTLLQDRQDSDLGRVSNTGGVVHVPPPPPAAAPHPGESNQEAAIRYLDTYVTSNHIGDPEPAVDDSVSQQSETDDGDFDQDDDADSLMTSDDEDQDDEDDDDQDDDEDEDDEDDHTSTDEDGGDDEDDDQDDEDDDEDQDDDHNVGFGEGDTSSTEIDGGTSADDGETSAIDDSPHDSPHDSSDPTTDLTGDSDGSVPETYDDTSAYTVDDTATTDTHASPQEAYSTEVV
jgi:hypothetical protein